MIYISYSNVDPSADFTISDFEDSDFEKEPDNIINVSECLRLNSGYVKVQGTIVSISKLYKLVNLAYYECSLCSFSASDYYNPPIDVANNNSTRSKIPSKTCDCDKSIAPSYNYVNAVSIELQDQNTFSDIDKLTCILFDNNTKNIRVGTNAMVSGHIHIVTRNKKSISCLYSTRLKYENEESTDLTNMDIEAIQRIVKLKGEQTVNWLSGKLFATSVIGFDIVKKGLLLSAVSSGVDTLTNNGVEHRNRLHTIIVGDPGTGKSRLLKECSKLLPNSRYESSQHSSGKSLTAIVSKENEEYFLRIGAIPLSHGSICALNEIGRMNYEDQGFLLDVMEEGSFTINKHGINAKVNSSTVIVATSNPMGSSWKKYYENHDHTGYGENSTNFNKYDDPYNGKIDLSKIPVLNPILDRFDLVFIIRSLTSENDYRDYANIKTNQVSDPRRTPSYYPYLKKHIQYCKKINPVLTDEAKTIINEFYVKLASSSSFTYGSSKRALEKLIRIAKAITKLKLKHRVEASDAKEALEFFNAVIYQYVSSVISVPQNPKDRTVESFIEILRKSPCPFSLEELVKEACKKDDYIKSYLLGGSETDVPSKNKFKISSNKKLRNVYEILVDDPKIHLVSSKPVVISYIKTASDPNDLSDLNLDINKHDQINDNCKKTLDNVTHDENLLDCESRRSDRSHPNELQNKNDLSQQLQSSQTAEQLHQENSQLQIALKHSTKADISNNEIDTLGRDGSDVVTVNDDNNKPSDEKR
ncbi:AAA family ATPase [Candidatus Nitrosocosmicus hydrocola]|uniref:AAA family ATPase n=1 Tax=Candidatus Nitrosocosmicus hydrocola TaxID=1826872 RepID=UPI0011E5BE0A|nr:AAA family ATPase [Candidatus Nitrosocosmicus hydrocola]